MPCNTPINSSGESYRGIGKSKTKYACVVEADESTSIRVEGVPFWYHEDHIAATGIHSLGHCNLVHKFIPMPQALKIPDAKATVEKSIRKNEKDTGMTADESQKQKRRDR